jgi:hypothetical protein
LRLDGGSQIRALGVLWLCCVAGSASALSERPWTLQNWGAPATVADASPDAGCAQGRTGTAYRFTKARTGGGGAELIIPGVLAPGKAYEFVLPVRSAKGAPVALDVFFRKDGPYYETTSIRTVQAGTAWQQVTLKGIYDAPRAGSVRLALRQDGTSVCLGQPELREINPDVVGGDDALHAVSPYFFGIHLNKLGRHSSWPSFEPDVLRMWATATTWNELQPKASDIDWRRNPSAQRLDYFVKHTRKWSRKTAILMTLGLTPPWAAASGDNSACEHSPFGSHSCMPPGSMVSWRAFVRELADRYDDRIDLWEIWNEADVSTHWVGSPETLVEMTRVAAEEIRKINPHAKIIGPNVTTLGLRLLNDFLVLGGAKYVDGLSIHAYINRSPWMALWHLRNTREMMRAYGVNLPLWNTETNTACGADAESDMLLQQKLCDMRPTAAIAQALIGEAALGIENVSFYTWEGAELNVGGVGLVKSDYQTATEEGELYEVLAKMLKGSSLRMLPTAGALSRALYVKGGRQCMVVWTDGRPAKATAQQLDNPASVRAVDGSKVEQDAMGAWMVDAMPVMACGVDKSSAGSR